MRAAMKQLNTESITGRDVVIANGRCSCASRSGSLVVLAARDGSHHDARDRRGRDNVSVGCSVS